MSATAEANPPAAVKAPDPEKDPAGYLKARGWRCEGNPRRSQRWFRPGSSPEPKTEKVKVGVRKLASGKTEDVYQEYYTPAAWPVSRQDALDEQMEKDGFFT